MSRPPSSAARAALLALALLLAHIAAAPVVADHGGREIGSFAACDRPVDPPRCTSVGNNERHYVALDPSLTPDLAQSLRDSMREDYDDPTKLVLVEQAVPNALTDVVAFSGDYGENGAAGWVYCPPDVPQGTNPAGHRWCKGQELHLNLNPRYAIFFDDDASRDHVTCHELGHTLGLRHWGNPPESDGPVGLTCMNANTPNGPTSLSPMDLDHIEAYAFRTAKEPRPLVVDQLRAESILATTAPGSFEATGLETPETTEELVRSADAVVVGRVPAVEPGRIFGPAGARLHYAAVTVRVDRVLAGHLPAADAGTLVLEVPLWDGPSAIVALRDALVGTERILALRSKAASAEAAGIDATEDAGRYRLVTFGSEIIARDGRAVVPQGDDGPFAHFAGRAFAAVADAIARIGSGRR